jgi:Fe-S-cluster containining protein
MEKDPAVVAKLAADLEEENWRFRTFLKSYCRLSDARLNRLAREAGERAAAQINCLECGACCRQIVVPLTDEEIDTMAAAKGISPEVFRPNFVQRVEHEDQAIDAYPCPLQEGNACTVYDSRPDPCRGYPYLGASFRAHSVAIIERAGTCPIVFEMLEQLKRKLGFRKMAE